jgi:hypothetical protein
MEAGAISRPLQPAMAVRIGERRVDGSVCDREAASASRLLRTSNYAVVCGDRG